MPISPITQIKQAAIYMVGSSIRPFINILATIVDIATMTAALFNKLVKIIINTATATKNATPLKFIRTGPNFAIKNAEIPPSADTSVPPTQSAAANKITKSHGNCFVALETLNNGLPSTGIAANNATAIILTP